MDIASTPLNAAVRTYKQQVHEHISIPFHFEKPRAVHIEGRMYVMRLIEGTAPLISHYFLFLLNKFFRFLYSRI